MSKNTKINITITNAIKIIGIIISILTMYFTLDKRITLLEYKINIIEKNNQKWVKQISLFNWSKL